MDHSLSAYLRRLDADTLCDLLRSSFREMPDFYVADRIRILLEILEEQKAEGIPITTGELNYFRELWQAEYKNLEK